MGMIKPSTTATFNLYPVGRKIEGDPTSGKSANKRGKGKNGGSNNASPGLARPSPLLPPETSPSRGNKSRTPSAPNTPTPTPSPPTSPETKKENLSRGVFFSRVLKGGSTDTENRERSAKQSLNTSPHTSPPQPQPSSLQGSSPPAPKPPHQPTENPNTTTAVVEVGPANKTLGPSSSGTGLQDKQDNVKPAALRTFDLPTPPASPEIQNKTVPAALEDGPAPFLLGNPSGLADMDKQDDVKSAALLSSSPLTPPASSEIRNLAVQTDLENGSASSNSPPENASGLAELKDKEDDVKSAPLPTSDRPTTPASPAVPADLEDRPAPSLLETASISSYKDPQDDVKSAVLPSSKSCHYYF